MFKHLTSLLSEFKIHPIRPWVSQGIGVLVSGIVGLAVYWLVSWFIQHTLNFWYLEEILKYIPGVPLGVLAAYETFVSRRKEVPISRVGVCKLFGALTKVVVTDGHHWLPPLVELITVPGPSEQFTLSIPGTRIGTRNGSEIYFGTFTPNSIQYSIEGAAEYIVVDDPEAALCAEYMGAAKLFFGQAAESAAARNEGRLFPDFIMLPQKGEDDKKHEEFLARLERAKFEDADGEEEDLFSPDARRMLMEEAGTFASNIKRWGIGKILAFVPDIREDSATQAAIEAEQAAEQDARTLSVKIESLKRHVGDLSGLKVSPDFALAAALKVSGQNVEIVHRNMPEFMGMPGGVAVGANQQRRKHHGNRKGSGGSGSTGAQRS